MQSERMTILVILVLVALASAKLDFEFDLCPTNGEYDLGSFVYRVPKHDSKCSVKAGGTLRYRDNTIQFCNGKEYVDLGVVPQRPSRIGTKDNPAMSCRHIIAKHSDAESGLYFIKTGREKVTQMYCYMEEICGSKGWAMVMKIDGSKNTFRYSSAYWTNKATYNSAAAVGGLNEQETKLRTYWELPFNALCLGMKTGGNKRWQKLVQRASSLYSLIADNRYRATRLGRNAWKKLIPGSSLQRSCNREGFNAYNKGAMARIGIISNQEKDCNSPDSRIGFGTAGSNCGQNNANSAGNEARCSADNGNKGIKSFGYIFAQESLGPAPLGTYQNPATSCRAIKLARSASKNGVYYIKLRSGAIVKAFCYMGVICGSSGWTMIMKIDGKKNTFRYSSAYWTNKATYNSAAAVGGLNEQETKLRTYWELPFNALCLGMKTGGNKRWQKLVQRASSLYSLIADNRYRATRLGRNAWKKLIPGSSLQRSCNREGFNAYNKGAMARIGIISNQEKDCNSPDSRIGFGTAGSNCGQNNANSAGNEARCSPDNGNKGIKSFGYIFAQERLVPAPLGAYQNPATSCRAIKVARSASKNGVYYIKLRSGAIVKAFCYMGVICGSSGWTMIMKIDGKKNTFRYSSAYWTNKATYNSAAAVGGLNEQETKLRTYWELPFNALCLGMKTGGNKRWQKLVQRASSLYSLIADNRYRATRLGRNAWKKLIPGSSLQRNCNREGFNAYNKGAMARIGIISNQEKDCNSPDSRIGFGTAGSYCGQNNANSAGNEARCSSDNGNKGIKSFGYIFAA